MTIGTWRPAGLAKRLIGAALISVVSACSGATATAPATQSPSAGPVAAVSPTPGATAGAVCVAKPAGLVAWWRAEGDAKDATGGSDGTLEGGATFTAGMVGQAFSLDGKQQFVEVANPLHLQLRTAITLEGWVYPAGAPDQYAGIAGTWDDSTGAFRTYLFWALNGTLELVVSPDGSTYQRATDVAPLPVDRWTHVAATYDGTTIRLYRDGTEVASTPMTGAMAINTGPFTIGRTEGGSVGLNFWRGSIDELTVYDRALSGAEIAGIHGAGSAGKCAS